MLFNERDYWALHALTFGTEGYEGYKPNVQESPDGNGEWDTGKRYAHVTEKYGMTKCRALHAYFKTAFAEAERVHHALMLPARFRPHWDFCCLRILEYQPGAGSAIHTDFDFFTIALYRDDPDSFVRYGQDMYWIDRESPGLHFGEMAEVAGVCPATRHKVRANGWQRSIVFFALPNLNVELQPNLTARDWLTERYTRSRRDV